MIVFVVLIVGFIVAELADTDPVVLIVLGIVAAVWAFNRWEVANGRTHKP